MSSPCKSACTSVCMLGTDPVLPLAIAELLLLGLLGPEPGALLQREETGGEADRDRAGELFIESGINVNALLNTLFNSTELFCVCIGVCVCVFT